MNLKKLLAYGLLISSICFVVQHYFNNEERLVSTVNESVENVTITDLTGEEAILEYQRIIGWILFPSIYESINQVYGKDERAYWKEEIISIDRGYDLAAYMYRIKIQFETFTVPHNPPFDKNIAVYDIMSFDPLQVNEVSFKHEAVHYEESNFSGEEE